MGLFTYLQRQGGATAVAGDAAQAVDLARMRARRRLIGAVLLLGIGVVAFPVLFETQPRPIPVDIAIEIPRKDGLPALVVPPPRAAAPAASPAAPVAPMITESKVEAAPAAATPPAAASARDAAAPAKPAAAKVEAKAAAVAAAAPSQADRALPSTAEAKGRFVVQVGAYADAAVAREARGKVEKLGLRTYTQAVETDNGKRTRVRLGPFGSREEAEAAAAKVKAAGLPAAVLAL